MLHPAFLPLALSCVLVGCHDDGATPDRVATMADTMATEPTAVEYVVATVVEGLEHPWAVAFLPGNDGILITERPGRLRLVRGGTLVREPIQGVPAVFAEGQGGLLDVVLHPDFAGNRLVYLSYSKPGPDGATTAVARGRLQDGRLSGVEDVFVADAWGTGGRHFGSRIVFGADGMMYVTVGERGDDVRAQNVRDHAGTTVRLHDDGRVPRDNPFVDRADVRDEIYTYGNRNVQAAAQHPESGELWQAQHGPRTGDQIHRLVAGANYGWPDYSFGNHYDGRPIPDPQLSAGIELPAHVWTGTVAPSGMTFYTGDAFPQWRGDMFVGSLAGEHVQRLRIQNGTVSEQERLLEDRGQRIRDVRTGPDGLLYVLVDAASAPLLRLEPATAGS